MSTSFIHLGLGWVGDRCGGLERYQDGVCRAHHDLGYDVCAWVQSSEAVCSATRQVDGEYPVTVYASPKDSRRIRTSKLLELAKSSFDNSDLVFVSHHASVSSPILSHLRGTPHVAHFQGPWAQESAIEGGNWLKCLVQKQYELRAYKNADRLIVLSEAFREILVRDYRVPDAKVQVIPGAVDFEKMQMSLSRAGARQQLEWPQNRPILLAVRRLVKRVGVDVLIDAIALLKAENKLGSALFMIGGTGALAQVFKEKLNAYGLCDHVKMLGFIADEQLPLAYRAADLCLVPTQSLEGFGLVTIEAMANGTPVACTPVGSLKEILEPWQPQMLFPSRTARSIADWLAMYLKNQVRVPTAQECREHVQKFYDWKVVGPQVLAVYRAALG